MDGALARSRVRAAPLASSLLGRRAELRTSRVAASRSRPHDLEAKRGNLVGEELARDLVDGLRRDAHARASWEASPSVTAYNFSNHCRCLWPCCELSRAVHWDFLAAAATTRSAEISSPVRVSPRSYFAGSLAWLPSPQPPAPDDGDAFGVVAFEYFFLGIGGLLLLRAPASHTVGTVAAGRTLSASLAIDPEVAGRTLETVWQCFASLVALEA